MENGITFSLPAQNFNLITPSIEKYKKVPGEWAMAQFTSDPIGKPVEAAAHIRCAVI